MTFTTAITRKPGINFAAGITGVKWAAPPDYDLVCRQHQAYTDTLRALGLKVVELDPDPDFPDAYFVEDTAVILGDTAVVTRPGAAARMGEAEKIAPILQKYKKIDRIHPPGLLDGGDVMVAEKHVYIGLSQRTNTDGARQLGEKALQLGFSWSALPVLEALHLKTGINYIGGKTFLMFPAYSDKPEFREYRKITVAAGEEPAANTLNVNGTLLIPAGYPKTAEKLKRLGRPTIEMDISEVAKMDGGLSCLSLRL